MKNIKNVAILLLFAFIIVHPSWNGKPPAYDPRIKTTGQTSSITPTNLVVLPLATGKTMRVITEVFGYSGNNRLHGIQGATIKNIAGTLTVIGSTPTDIMPISADGALSTAVFSISTSGTNVIVLVTGIVGVVDWVSYTSILTD